MRGFSPRNSQLPAGCACAWAHEPHTLTCQALPASVWVAAGAEHSQRIPWGGGCVSALRKGWSAADHVGQATPALDFCELVADLSSTHCPHLSWSYITIWTLNLKPLLAMLLGVLTSLWHQWWWICMDGGMDEYRLKGEVPVWARMVPRTSRNKKLFHDVSDRSHSRNER